MKLSKRQKEMVTHTAEGCLSVRLRLMNRMVGAIYDEALRPHGIRASQLNILVAVAASGRTTSKQLCGMLCMDASTFSRTLAILKKNFWLKVVPSGTGKILNVEITGQGLTKIEAVYPDWRKAQEKAVAALGKPAADMLITAANRHLLAGMRG